MDFAFKPLTIGFALDAAGRSQIMDYELKFVSYGLQICLFEKDAGPGRGLDKGMTMVFSFVPEPPRTTSSSSVQRNNAGRGGDMRTKDKFPFSLPVHKDCDAAVGGAHHTEIRALRGSERSRRTCCDGHGVRAPDELPLVYRVCNAIHPRQERGQEGWEFNSA